MNRLEMAKKLFDNPKLKAIRMGKDMVHVRDYGNYKCIAWVSSESTLQLELQKDEEWEIIEPVRKLKEFCFGEMYYIWVKDEVNVRKIKSVLSGLTYKRGLSTIPLEEYKRKWTIEGYEEDDNNV